MLDLNWEINHTFLDGVILYRRKIFIDGRGTFKNLFPSELEQSIFFTGPKMQINVSETTSMGTVRGYHYQIDSAAEYKIVTCINGSIFDQIIDLRKESKTYGKIFSVNLSKENGYSLLIPPYCAHGFQALENNVKLIYMHSNLFQANSHFGINPITTNHVSPWPKPVLNVSHKDLSLPSYQEVFEMDQF